MTRISIAVIFPKSVGIVPVKLLFPRLIFLKLVTSPSSLGIDPVKKLFSVSKCVEYSCLVISKHLF